jgi:hypothetical protein
MPALTTASLLPQVPPGKSEDFIDAWTDAAYETIKEDSNNKYRWVLVAFS